MEDSLKERLSSQSEREDDKLLPSYAHHRPSRTFYLYRCIWVAFQVIILGISLTLYLLSQKQSSTLPGRFATFSTRAFNGERA